MKIGVSNLAWDPITETQALFSLTASGASGVEVAPTRIAPWGELATARLTAFRDICSAAGLTIPSLQAIFFGRPDVQLLQDTKSFAAMCEHLHRVGAIAEALGAGIVVFGAPDNRHRGDADPIDRLRRLGDVARDHGIVVGIEPVPAIYGNDFAARASELIPLLRAVGHPNVRFHMDCACVQLSGDDPVTAILDAADLLVHYHAAEPNLSPLTTNSHVACAAALRRAGFNGWAVIEMRPHGLVALDAALRLARETYGED